MGLLGSLHVMVPAVCGVLYVSNGLNELSAVPMSCFVIVFVTPATSCCSPNSCSPSCPTLSVPLSKLTSQCNGTYSSHTRTLSSPARYWLPAVVCVQLTVVKVSPLCAAVVLTMPFASSKCAEAFHLDVELGSHSSTMGYWAIST